MKTKTTLAALLLAAVMVTPSYGDNVVEPNADKSLEEKLQGKWARHGHWVFFVIKGDRCDQYATDKPLNPNSSGRLIFEAGRDYAVGKSENGWIGRMFSAGENTMCLETFTPSGEVQGEGRIFYRINSDSP